MKRSELRMRWVVLIFSSLALVGNYYCYDNPAALKALLQQHFNDIDPNRYELLYSLLYSVYSAPNIIIPLFGGFMVDKVGVKVMLLVLSALVTGGQVIFALGCSLKSFLLMLIGRMIFGLGGESLNVAVSSIIAVWFESHELAFAMSISTCVGTLAGSVFNNEASPYIANKSNVSYALWFGLMLCELSLVAAIIVVYLERRVELRLAQVRQQRISKMEPTLHRTQSITLSDILTFKPSFWIICFSVLVSYGSVIPYNSITSSLLMERDYFIAPPVECTRCGFGAYEGWEICTSIAENCPSVPPYSWPLPKLSANCKIKTPQDQVNCSTEAPWVTASTIDCSKEAWKFGPKTFMYCSSHRNAVAATAAPMSIPYTIASLMSPIFGLWVDKMGMQAASFVVGSIGFAFVHLLSAWTTIEAWTLLVLQGVAYSLYCAVVASIVPGTAYGILSAFNNFGLGVIPLLVTGVYSASGQKYIPNVEILFLGFSICGIILGIALNWIDSTQGWRLNKRVFSQLKDVEDSPLLLETLPNKN